MVRRIGLLTTLLYLPGAIAVGTIASSSAASCNSIDIQTGVCASAVAKSSEVDVMSKVNKSRGAVPGGGQSISGAHGTQIVTRSYTEAELRALWIPPCGDATASSCEGRGGSSLNPLFRGATTPAPSATPGQPARTITITELARFLPPLGALHAEPSGWAVIGVPANFWVDVSPVTADGRLFGEAVQVRFTPRLYHWDYGDGASTTTEQPGASWAALGQKELTATATSHVYRVRATLGATASVGYSAEYRVGGGPWLGIDGAVTSTTPASRVLVVAEHTVLTAGASG